jgi:undecaprenyl-diphosphatase
MPLIEVIVLGIVQGLTEFLPISSTAHLALVPWLFGWKDPGLAFDIALHVGTLVAILVYFFRDWVQVIAQGFGARVDGDPVLSRNRMLLWLMAIGTLPVGIAGLIFGEQAETTWRSPTVIGVMMIIIAGVIWWAERVGRRQKDLGQLTPLDAVAIGAAQALSIVPGTSRSGITIAAGLFRNFDRRAAARFSFLLSAPAVGAAAAKDFYDLVKDGGIPPEMRSALLVGIIVSGITGVLVIQFFMNFLRKNTLQFFIAYRVIFGIIIIALAQFSRFGAG